MKKRQKIRQTLLLVFLFLFPAIFFYFSPYIIIRGTVEGIITGSFIVFVGMFISSLFLGRAFCGWICPGGKSQDIIMEVNRKRITKGNVIKWLIWIPWIAIIVIIAVKNGGYKSIQPFYNTTYGFSIGSFFDLIVYFFVLLLIVLPAFIFGKRSFCHSICWMAPFMILGRKIRNLFGYYSLQLSSNKDNCVSCHSCTKKCPMSLEVEKMVKAEQMENDECILCANCVDNCHSKAIKLHFGKTKQPQRKKTLKNKKK